MSELMAEHEDDTPEEIIDEVIEDDTELSNEGAEISDTTEQNDSEDDVVVTIGEAAPASEEHVEAPAWVKELRKQNRELIRRTREQEEQLRSFEASKQTKVEVGSKPKLEDVEYDPDRYEEELAKWYERKRVADEQAIQVQRAQEEARQAWQGTLEHYQKLKSELKVKDYEDTELIAQQLLSNTQQGIILQGAENPALLVYALGKNPKKMKELADIKDPVKYAFAVAKLETQLKVTQRKAPPPENKVEKGSARISGSIDSQLDRLYAEAAKTGDLTKVHQYRQKLKQKSK